MMAGDLAFGPQVMAWADALAACTEQEEGLTRVFLSPEHKAAAELVLGWMAEAGMTADYDAIGNVVGRYEGERPGLPALLLGSHLDTVRDAGSYDGMLGVISAIACVKALHQAGQRLPFAIEVLGFGDEEGVRFPSTLMGSRAVAGTLDPAELEVRDADELTVREALGAFGLDPAGVPKVARRPEQVLAYVELHIEQGPVLEAEGLPVGIVTSIAGAVRYRVSLKGMAGHAGTVPMGLRQDALAAAAEIVLAVERRCSGTDGLVGTVGRMEVLPGAINVIPGAVELSLDIRAGADPVREAAVADLVAVIDEVCARRGVAHQVERIHDGGCCACAPWLMDQLEAAVRAQEIRPHRLLSGAGHDAMAFGGLADVAMLFVRCGGGISHNPAETITVEDADMGVRVLLEFIRNFQPK